MDSSRPVPARFAKISTSKIQPARTERNHAAAIAARFCGFRAQEPRAKSIPMLITQQYPAATLRLPRSACLRTVYAAILSARRTDSSALRSRAGVVM